MCTKAKAQTEHAKARARQRYGLTLNRFDLRSIAKVIQSGLSALVAHQSSRVSVHDVVYQGTRGRVVYDRHRKTLVTFLKPTWEPSQRQNVVEPWQVVQLRPQLGA